MNFRLLHRIGGLVVFLISTIVLLMTVAPTLSFWDCGEFITSAVIMGVPHPPGAPFFQLLGRIFTLLPFVSDLGMRMNLISTFSSSLSVLLLYLTTMRLLRMWHGDPATLAGGLTMVISSAVGALILSWSDTFWFNASESEVYAIGIFFIAIVVWIALEWYAHQGMFDSERSLLLIAYLMGLSIGIHLLSLLALFFVFFLIYFRDRGKDAITARTFVIALALMAVGFGIVYPGVVKYIPGILAGGGGWFLMIVIIGGLIALTAAKKMNPQVRIVALSVLLVTLGYSTYVLVVLRANDKTALNENDPHDLKTLYSYLNRDQYGTYPLLRGPNYDPVMRAVNPSVEKLFPRRWNPENVEAYSKYSSDFSYFVEWQFGHMFLRYFLMNFVGRAGDIQDAPVAWFSNPGDWSESAGYPNRYYAIPLLLGLIGFYYHFRKDWKTGLSMAALWFITGIGLVIYFNMAEPQPRERDYFYIGAFYVFALWAGVGVYGIYDMLKERSGIKEGIGVLIGVAALVIAPLNMLRENYQTHDRHYNYVAFDYAYDLLQSCDRDAILFTGGDNDTFPVWYLQYAAGVRRDVRVVNLSLVNTPWYALQLKNERPYGARTVEMSYSDNDLETMMPVAFERQVLTIPIDASKIDLRTMQEVPQVKAQPGIPATMEWVITAPWQDPNGTKGLRNQDLMIIDIVRNNINSRPIYFALSTAPSDRLGLDEHMIVEGLASRVTPYKFQTRPDRYYPMINTSLTMKQLFDLRATPDSNRAVGFMFRELNNPRINLDEASTRMILSFRYLYMGLAQVMYQDNNDRQGASAVLSKMEQVMPQAIHRMDPVMQTDLSTMYYLVGDTTNMKKLAVTLEPYYLKELEKDITGRSSSRSPYSVLLNIYEMTGQWQKGIDLMKRYQAQYPQDQSIVPQIQSWERKARGETADTAVKR